MADVGEREQKCPPEIIRFEKDYIIFLQGSTSQQNACETPTVLEPAFNSILILYSFTECRHSRHNFLLKNKICI